MDSELQAALSRFIVGRRAPEVPKEVNDDLEVIFKAARKVANLQIIVDEQAEDVGLWFVAQTASEAYLQQELRRLHAAIEEAPDGQ